MIYDDFLNEEALVAYAQALNNRAKQNNLTVASLRDRILASAGKCEWCAVSLLLKEFEIDHIIALSSGGSHSPENLAVACPDCNRSKSAKHPARFAQETFARTGIMTPLLRRILDNYQSEATKQKSLFANLEETPQLSEKGRDDEPPPYVWKRS